VPDGQADARIGERLRAARLTARKSMAEVAADAGLTKGFLSKLERDLANVSVASLMRLCDALGIPVGSLFEPPKGEVVRAADRRLINFGGTFGLREYLLTPIAERRMQAILSDIEPGGGSGDEAYSLPSDVEFVLVLDGKMEIALESELIALGAGDAFTFPAGAPHSFRAVDGPAQVLWVVSPALPDGTRY
jgi:transcriptional regulator with XRE-family HTH domain